MSDHQRCPTCGQSIIDPRPKTYITGHFYDGWTVGDKVLHLTRLRSGPQDAVITKIDEKGVHVQFEGDPKGILNTECVYDDEWYRIVSQRHVGGLLVKP